MSRGFTPRAFLALTTAAALLAGAFPAARGQSAGGAYRFEPDLAPSGGTSTGGVFSVRATAGLPIAGVSANGAFAIVAGPVQATGALPTTIFQDSFEGL